jgi:hypothetical protein
MLHIPTAFDNATQARSTKSVTGQFLAKNKRDRQARTELAVDIIDGDVKIRDLTVGQIAYLCRVSRSSVDVCLRLRRYARRLRQSESLAQRFARSTADERRELTRTAGVDVLWDELIQPSI